ncbi:MAG: AMP-binding protein [Alicyclobacillus herbarius]|uniref:AMP-binding protein n=1 Tax=Alicyclobacillus herbarius TaxID=122960 RepID=UPI0023526675|nr:AMP-binding protein [Alicyclobacillus herbarius]MCL6633743.1 AMP-binding protein [Alicyclobacillus herbarius]
MSQLIERLFAAPFPGESPCLHFAGRWHTRREVFQEAERLAAQLAAAGVKPGQRVVLGVPNSTLFAVTWLALIRLGAVAAPCNPEMPVAELTVFFERCQAAAAVLRPEQWQVLGERGAVPDSLEQVWLTDDVADPQPSRRLVKQDGGRWVEAPLPVDQAPKAANTGGLAPVSAVSDEAQGVLLYTSGTTGAPKAVALRHRHLLATANNVILSHRLTQDDVTYCFLPMFHINAQVIAFLSTLLSGGRIILAPRFSASSFWPTVEEFGVTWVSAVPTIIAILLKKPRPERIPDSLRFVRSASAPLPVLDAKRFEREFGIPIIQSYGMTEAASQICVNPLPPGERRLGSVGRPVGLELQVVDEANRPLPPGQIGEIVIRGASVIEAYEGLDSPKDFAGGWFHTGDLGYQDEDGYVYLTGRKKEMINRAGEKVSPYEVEDVIREHPRVRQVGVIGLPDRLYGERVTACVVTDAAPSEQERVASEILELCQSSLSRYKWPAEIRFVDTIPVGPTGKVQRTRLKQELMETMRVPAAKERRSMP